MIKIPMNYVFLAEDSNLAVKLRYDHCRSWSSEEWVQVQAHNDKLAMQHERKEERSIQGKSSSSFSHLTYDNTQLSDDR